MRDLRLTRGRVVGLAVALAVLVALTLARGVVVLAAAVAVVLVVALIGLLVPLQRDDGVDWDWLPRRADEVPPEPGIGALRRLLAPDRTDTTAPAQLQDLVRTLAAERLGGTPERPVTPPDGPLARYLAAPPRRLSTQDAEAVIADLESLRPTQPVPPTKETA
ncbi:hypothetical protein [Arthrobacter sp. NEB 688]|uniref:hypothetical protein n=1 Tax=Arthrobacter sp. NEB 688 TaxID=904039 RepID=UPI001565B0F6|nr:hypothetical protein [Arthrobacter sp. NEB 688]QKE85350.1 hypothetical protein HL663_16325 [Arthrobacter sp. NEB 688]